MNRERSKSSRNFRILFFILLLILPVSTSSAVSSVVAISISPPAPVTGVIGGSVSIDVKVGVYNEFTPGYVYVGVSPGVTSFPSNLITCNIATVQGPASAEPTLNIVIPSPTAPQTAIYTVWAVLANVETSDSCPPPASYPSKSAPYSIQWNYPPQPDSDGDGVPDSQDACPTQGDQGGGVDPSGCPLPPPPDFTVEIVSVTQSVDNPDFNNDRIKDYVQNKPLAIFIRPAVTNIAYLSLEETVAIKIDAVSNYGPGPATQSIYNGTISIQQIFSVLVGGNMGLFPDIAPTITGDMNFVITIDYDNKYAEGNELNNTDSWRGRVTATRPIKMLVVPMNFAVGGETFVANTAKKIEQFDLMLSAFPVPPDSWTDVTFDFDYINASKNENVGTRDDSLLFILRYLYTAHPGYNRYIIYVPVEYAVHYKLAKNGRLYGGFWPHASSVFIVDKTSRSNTLAHEMLHSIGILREGYEDSLPDQVDSGYWVSRRQNMAGADEFMYGPSDFSWIREDDYNTLFNIVQTDATNAQLAALPDPELLVFTGFIQVDGTLRLKKLDYVPSGLPDEISTNDTVTLLNFDRDVILSTPLGVSYKIGEETLKRGMFSSKITFPPHAFYAQVSVNNVFAGEVNLHVTLLRQMIKDIPGSAFIRNATELRQVMLKFVDKLEAQYRHGRGNVILKRLTRLRGWLDEWLDDDYELEGPFEYNKQKAFGLVDRLYASVEASLSQPTPEVTPEVSPEALPLETPEPPLIPLP
jgi:hypothetical protein